MTKEDTNKWKILMTPTKGTNQSLKYAAYSSGSDAH
jgi:hypothetical protein